MPNQLINESSPYLLQHANNPVNWYAWHTNILEKAKQENKPILVSIGYAACHWCHVMEKESFEDAAIASIMNEHFINIKIDREERPDLDSIFMDAVQAITGSGGWPLNVFLTPNGKPFFGGTYFPPTNNYGRLSWKEVLENIIKAFDTRKDEIETQAEQLTQHIITSNNFSIQKNNETTFFSEKTTKELADSILQRADTTFGGFGKAPKFPQTISIQYLLRQYYFTKNETALNHALLSLDKMIAGGIYDQLAGGFARYSTDEKWFAPHFEKMLYDNALLITVLSEAYQLTKKGLYKEVIEQTIRFLETEMKSPTGGYYSAIDADSENVEGKFYTWKYDEIINVLGNDANIFCKYFSVTQKGNWDGTNILFVEKEIKAFCKENNVSEVEFKLLIEKCKQKLLVHRNNRIRPLTDDKIILNNNALLITALVKAYCATLNESYKILAEELIRFINETFFINNKIYHTYKNGEAKIEAFLDDIAYLIQANIFLQEITGNEDYLFKANELTEVCLNNFFDGNLFFYYTSQKQTDVLVRKVELYDGATPSANSVMAFNLFYLSIVFDNTFYKSAAVSMINALNQSIIKYPISFSNWSILIQLLVFKMKEIVIVGEQFMQSLPAINHVYSPNKIIQSTDVEKKYFPLLKFKPLKEKNSFYLCSNYSCKKPQFTVEAFLANL